LSEQPVFLFDLGSPECYLVAERVMSTMPVIPEWQPVLASAVGAGVGELDIEQLSGRAAELGLLPFRMPAVWPPNTEFAMRTAMYAKGGGKTVPFALAAFRQAFAGGRDLGDQDTVLIAAAACEMHPTAVLKGAGLRSVARRLSDSSLRARDDGVVQLPTILVDGELFAGEDAPEQAALALGVR
jgi:2-hydroxychromene-2-carboxylate isomerase